MGWLFVLRQLPSVVSPSVSAPPCAGQTCPESFLLLWEAVPPLLPVPGWELKQGEHSTEVAAEMEPETAEEWEVLQEGVKCWARLASKSSALWLWVPLNAQQSVCVTGAQRPRQGWAGCLCLLRTDGLTELAAGTATASPAGETAIVPELCCFLHHPEIPSVHTDLP